jgi:hypothetical protein
MARTLAFLLFAVFSAVAARPAHAASYIALYSQPYDYFGGGREILATDIFVQGRDQFWGQASAAAPAVSVVFLNRAVNGFAALLTPGLYVVPGEEIETPRLSIGVDHTGCGAVGQFRVHEAVVGATGYVSFAADFDARCPNTNARYYGAVRYNSSVPYENPASNRDGGPILIWRSLEHHTWANPPNPSRPPGALWATAVDGFGIIAGRRIWPDILDADWKIVGAADFNSDDSTDLVFQHADGRVAFWLLQGTQLLDGRLATPDRPPGINDQAWRVAAVADVNRDGAPDLLWRHEVNGSLAVWLMNGTSLREGRALSPFAGPVDWWLVAAGDIDGDGYVDLLWRHRSDGRVAFWRMQEERQLSGAVLADPVPLEWELKGLSDVNRDGFLDLVWDNPTLQRAAIWLMRGTSVVAGELLTPSVGANYAPDVIQFNRWILAAVR